MEELAAIRSLLGERAPRVPVTATKSAIGHTLGAAGAIALVAILLAMRDGRVPPTLNLTDPDPGVGDMDLTPLVARDHDVRVAVINAFGFGGQNAALVVRRWDES
jgi:3-oxoacyl-[acyl-carrier-protein] synthase II